MAHTEKILHWKPDAHRIILSVKNFFLCLTEPSFTMIVTLIQFITHPLELSQTLHHFIGIMAREVGVL